LTSHVTASWLVMMILASDSKASLRLSAVAMENLSSGANSRMSLPQAQERIDLGAKIKVGKLSCLIASITTRVLPVPGSLVFKRPGVASMRCMSTF